jgi:hypothetical protein
MISRRTLFISGLSTAALSTIGYRLWPRVNAYNYEVARQRRLLMINPQIIDFIQMATLAANGHNTQPWKFQLDEGRVSILPDLKRATPVVDPDDHHLYISLGCAAENLIIAAQAAGRSTELEIVHGLQTTIDITLKSGLTSNSSLYQAIPIRQSTRSTYDGQPTSTKDLNLLKAAAKEEGVSVLFFESRIDRETILEFVIEGNSAQMDDTNFVVELRDWVRFSSDHVLTRRDGLFSACSGNPVLPDWLGPTLFNMTFTKNSENDKYRDHIRSSAGIAVFIGNHSDPEHWIKVGRSFERFALQATALGIRNAHINQPIEVPSVRSEFARWLGLPDARPDLVIRFGRAPALPMSLRRRVENVII